MVRQEGGAKDVGLVVSREIGGFGEPRRCVALKVVARLSSSYSLEGQTSGGWRDLKGSAKDVGLVVS